MIAPQQAMSADTEEVRWFRENRLQVEVDYTARTVTLRQAPAHHTPAAAHAAGVTFTVREVTFTLREVESLWLAQQHTELGVLRCLWLRHHPARPEGGALPEPTAALPDLQKEVPATKTRRLITLRRAPK